MDKDLSLSGFLLIDKPAGISSFDVIRKLRRQTGIRTFGHAGTLDPFATGLLLLAVNKYTRLLALLDAADKSYEATMFIGKSTSTGDPEGEVTAISKALPDTEKIDLLQSAVLNIEQLKPPAHSALKINGKRAYELARKDIELDLPERPVRIHEFEVLQYDYPYLKYACRVSKGTYIRSLSQWIAQYLDVKAYTLNLRRTAIGKIDVKRSISPELIDAEGLQANLQQASEILDDKEMIVLDAEALKLLSQGRTVLNPGADQVRILILDESGMCHGIAMRQEGILHPKVNLC